MIFVDRADAGRQLAAKLEKYRDRPGVIVLALPRGGVLVGFEVARLLNTLLDVFVVRKLGVPGHEELALGAIASRGVLILNRDVIHEYPITDSVLELLIARERRELERRQRLYRGARPEVPLSERTVILVDDGLATGSSMRAAIKALREFSPARIVVAVPVGSPRTCQELESEADEVICCTMPDPLVAVGYWYQQFDQTTDQEVQALLETAAEPQVVSHE
ncbi:MAG: putative phosphoribosyl transferase [Planctomycetaceae bacterium]|nr:putative phosphoribosyl transferase [Planctomycetaceae bacterium]